MATRRTRDGSATERSEQAFLLNDAGFLKEVVERLVQELVETELNEYLGAERYERSEGRRGFRPSGRAVSGPGCSSATSGASRRFY